MAEKTQYSATDIEITPIVESDALSLSNFSCGVDKIDHFFREEAIICSKYKSLIPYKCVLKDSGQLVGAFTLANDLLYLDYEDKYEFPIEDDLYRDVFNQQTSYPAVNIGHLAVQSEYQSKGIGECIVSFVQITFTLYRQSGCQFITVDALNNPRALHFYEYKVNFDFCSLNDIGKPTRRMYLDIFTSPL